MQRRHAGWVKVFTETVAGTQWWKVRCLIEHEPNEVSEWWTPVWSKAISSAHEHLAMHRIRRVPQRPFDEVLASEH